MWVKEHCPNTTTKKWSKWTTCNKGKKTPKQSCEQNMLEFTLGVAGVVHPGS